MELTNVCPKCGSEDLFIRNNSCICGECGHRFQLEANYSASDDDTLLSTKTQAPMTIFLSYAHAQSEIVEEIKNGLVARGHRVWIDSFGINHGDDWRKKITDGLLSSNGVVSFLSKEAIRKNGVCLDELGIAVGAKYGNIRTVLLHKEADLLPIPSQLTHRQWLDMSDWKTRKNGDSEQYKCWINKNLAAIIRMIESQETREFEGHISLIRKKLGIIDSAISRQSWYLRQRFVGREWLTAEIEDWLSNPNGGHLCTVYGGPGVGKSAFAAQFVYHSPHIAASLFFEHGNNYFNSPDAIVRELIFQLACRLPGYRSQLIYTLHELSSEYALSVQELFERLLANPLQYTVDGGHETLCVVVDGLDECTEEGQRTAISLLKSERFPSWIRVLIFTRPESRIMDMLSPDKEIIISNKGDETYHDLHSYFELRLEDKLMNRQDRETILDALSERAEGVFLYAFVVTEMILGNKLNFSDLSVCPQGLSASFSMWFSRYFPCADEYNLYYRVPLGIMAACKEPIPVEELETADGFYDNTTHSYHLREKVNSIRPERMEKRLEKCALLLKYGTDDFGKKTVSFSHKYIAEWLSGSASQEFSCDPSDAFWLLQQAWRKVLDSDQPMTEYQALFLLSIMKRAGVSEESVSSVAKQKKLEESLDAFRSRYFQKGKWQICLPFANEEVTRCTMAYGSICESTYRAWDNLAIVYNRLGMYNDALEIEQHVFTETTDTLGTKHPFTLRMANNLSLSLLDLGNAQASLKLLQQNYETIRNKQGEDHPNTLAIMNNLALCYSQLGRYQEALELQKTVCSIVKQILGKNHPDTLTSTYNLALIYCKLGMHQEALEILEVVCAERERILGCDHPDTLASLSNLAAVYFKLKLYQVALKIQETVCPIQKRNLGEKHPHTLNSINNLTRIQRCIEIQNLIRSTAERITGREQPDTLSSMKEQAAFCLKAGMYQESLSLRKVILAANRRILGKEHPDTLVSMSNLANIYSDLDRHQDAFALRQTVYEIRKCTQGEEHPNTLCSMYNLAENLAALEKYQDALALHLQCYDMHKRVLGEAHFDTIIVAEGLAQVYSDLCMYQEALTIWLQILNTYVRIGGELNPDTRRALINVSFQYYELGQYSECISLDERIIRITETLFGTQSKEMATALNNLSMAYSKLNQYDEALPLMKQAYVIRRELLGEEDPLTEKCRLRVLEFRENCSSNRPYNS